jgi:hypothetical protein
VAFASDDEALVHDLPYALSFKMGRRLQHLDEMERRIVAKSVLEYLKLANWKFERGPGLQGHSQLGTGPPR